MRSGVGWVHWLQGLKHTRPCNHPVLTLKPPASSRRAFEGGALFHGGVHAHLLPLQLAGKGAGHMPLISWLAGSGLQQRPASGTAESCASLVPYYAFGTRGAACNSTQIGVAHHSLSKLCSCQVHTACGTVCMVGHVLAGRIWSPIAPCQWHSRSQHHSLSQLCGCHLQAACGVVRMREALMACQV